MEFLTRALQSDFFASVALVLVPWGLARLFAWWKAECRRKGEADYEAAVGALKVGVDEAWERFGREWKHARLSATAQAGSGSSGKLTDEEREKLRTVAREVAVEVGREKGLDVLKTVGTHALGTLIRKIVERRKRGGE